MQFSADFAPIVVAARCAYMGFEECVAFVEKVK